MENIMIYVEENMIYMPEMCYGEDNPVCENIYSADTPDIKLNVTEGTLFNNSGEQTSTVTTDDISIANVPAQTVLQFCDKYQDMEMKVLSTVSSLFVKIANGLPGNSEDKFLLKLEETIHQLTITLELLYKELHTKEESVPPTMLISQQPDVLSDITPATNKSNYDFINTNHRSSSSIFNDCSTQTETEQTVISMDNTLSSCVYNTANEALTNHLNDSFHIIQHKENTSNDVYSELSEKNPFKMDVLHIQDTKPANGINQSNRSASSISVREFYESLQSGSTNQTKNYSYNPFKEDYDPERVDTENNETHKYLRDDSSSREYTINNVKSEIQEQQSDIGATINTERLHYDYFQSQCALIFRPVVLTYKVVHLFHFEGTGWLSADEFVAAFTEFKTFKFMMDILPVYNIHFTLKEIKRSDQAAVFAKLDNTFLSAPCDSKGQITKIRLLSLESAIYILLQIKIIKQEEFNAALQLEFVKGSIMFEMWTVLEAYEALKEEIHGRPIERC